MAIVHCDRDGVPVEIHAFTGDPYGSYPKVLNPSVAFTVAIPDDVGRKIQKQPKLWRFPGVDTFDDRSRMRYIGAKGASESMVAKWQKASNAFADRVEEKRIRAEEQGRQNQAEFMAAMEVRKMLKPLPEQLDPPAKKTRRGS